MCYYVGKLLRSISRETEKQREYLAEEQEEEEEEGDSSEIEELELSGEEKQECSQGH